MLRRIIIAVDCADEAQRDKVQQIANEVSGMRLLTADRLIGMYPYVSAHRGDIAEIFGLVSKNGIKGIVSGRGIQLLTKLTR